MFTNQGDSGGWFLSKQEMQQIRADIVATTRPSWQTPPPSNLGSPGHGKLKADQWRTCIEFDIPVSLVRLASKSTEGRDGRLTDMSHATMLLAIAVQWVSSRQTSEVHAKNYICHLIPYLEKIKARPGAGSLVPNHHSACHVHEFLLRFGPTQGWWMFPFERIIGMLQGINTNHRLGEHNYTALPTTTHMGEQATLKAPCSTPSVRLETFEC